MNSFLLAHANFAIWAFVFIIIGTVSTWSWSITFRRLSQSDACREDLLWEARRGLAGGVIWLVAMGLIFLLMVTSFDITASEVVAFSDGLSEELEQSIRDERRLIYLPSLLAFGLTIGTIAVAGRWSGAWAALETEESSHV